MKAQPAIRILDTTLRDGEQAVGVLFTRREKEQLAFMLAGMGITALEAGFPALGPEEQDCVRAVAGAGIEVNTDGGQGQPLEVYAFARARKEDVRLAAGCGVQAVVISIATSDILIERKFQQSRAWVLEQMKEAAAEAGALGLTFTVSAEDASRSDANFLQSYYQAAQEMGASMIRYCDSLGIDDPFETYKRISDIRQEISTPIEIHAHNDFGMATANVLAGIRAGAASVSASIGGLGERVGNPPLEEIVMALKILHGVDVGLDTTHLRDVAEYVAGASRRAIPIWKAIIGTNVFAHESGIHADGILKNSATYEAFSPDAVGLTRQIVVGKHSGSRTIYHKFRNEFGIELDDDVASKLLARVRSETVELKRPLFNKELMLLYQAEITNRSG